MIGFILIAQVVAASVGGPPDLVELSRIVSPYAECEFKAKARMKPLTEEWLDASRKKSADPKNAELAAQADKLFEKVAASIKAAKETCGQEQILEQLRVRLLALHPDMDTAQAYWQARNVFNSLNTVNSEIIQRRAGVFPKFLPPPPQIGTSPEKLNAPNK